MKAITIRLEESTLESIDEEASEHGRSRSEHIREVLRARNEHAEHEQRIAELQRENERLRNEKRLILERREDHTELQRYVEDEMSYREAGLGTRLKWWMFGKKED